MSTQNQESNSSLTTQVVDIKPSKKPDELSTEQIANINAKADQSIKALIQTKGDIFSETTDQIVNVGVQDQKSVANNMALMQERMGNVFYSNEKSNVTDNLSKDIAILQNTLEKVNPAVYKNSFMFKYIGWIPFFGDRIVYLLKQSSNKGLTLQEFVSKLEASLKNGEIMLRQDNAQLKVINDELRTKQSLIKADAYFAEVLMEKLSEATKGVEDQQVKNNLNEVMFKLSTRAQDLRAMENIYEQFFVSLKMTKNNNELLIDGARRMQTMGMTVINVSMAIHSALIRAKNVKDVEVGTGQFIGKMLVSNATVINGMVTEIGDLYKNPFVPMKMMEDAVAQLQQAIETTNKLKSEGIEIAKENIGKIKIMTEEIKNKSGQLPDTNVKSLEASKTLLLTDGRG